MRIKLKTNRYLPWVNLFHFDQTIYQLLKRITKKKKEKERKNHVRCIFRYNKRLMSRRERRKPQLYKREIHIPVGEAATFGAENKIYGGRSPPRKRTLHSRERFSFSSHNFLLPGLLTDSFPDRVTSLTLPALSRPLNQPANFVICIWNADSEPQKFSFGHAQSDFPVRNSSLNSLSF